MTTTTGRPNPVDKHDARRRALAESALRTLGERGYARSSLREMANNSEFTHGVVHYYFADKLELIVYCVQYYKATCVTRYDEVVANSESAAELVDAFARKLCETIVDEAPMHRLWYDLRSQSMFEPRLDESVSHIDGTLSDMIWRVVTRYAELAGVPLVVDQPEAYGMFDGVFQQALLGHLREPDAGHLDRLDKQVHLFLPLMVEASG
jgi:TetR/AcrR family transcriptional regulator, transcriptional repressor of bet genes